jgi:hypothetical protein
VEVSREVFERLARIETTVENIADMMTKSEDRHEGFANRLAELERGNEKQKSLNVRFQHHLDHDVSVEAREGEYAKALLKWAAVIVGTTFFNQLPRVFELLK